MSMSSLKILLCWLFSTWGLKCCLQPAPRVDLSFGVPSSRLLFEDNDSGLFSVTLFRKAIDDFKHKARENKYIIPIQFYTKISFAFNSLEVVLIVCDS